MTHQPEHQALKDLEAQLRADDPEFVELFRLRATTDGRRDVRRAFSVAIVLAVLGAVLFVLLAQPVMAILCSLVAGGLAILRACYRTLANPPRPY